MKIIRLTAENVKRLRVVDITPAGPVVQVTGRNGSGKTSVLDSIWWALAGAAAIQSVPIRAGEEEARIRLDLGEIIVSRKFTAAGTSVVVLNAAGAEPGTPDKKLPKWGSPQEVLDALLAKLSFDPLAFARMAPKAQLDELRRIANLDLDVELVDSQNQADRTRRTEVNRQAKAKRAQAEGFKVPPNLPDTRVDEGQFMDQIEQAGNHNAAIEREKARRDAALKDAGTKRQEAVTMRDRAADRLKYMAERVAELEEQIKATQRDCQATVLRLVENAKAAEQSAADLEQQITNAEPVAEPIQVAELRTYLGAARATNAAISVREQRDQANAEAEALEARAAEITATMAGREQAKADAITAAKMPIDGLGFGDGAVTYKGLPLDQASDAEKLRVSCSIAMAANSKLRVIRIRDGSLLDDDGLKLIGEMAAANDYQVWVERVDSTGKIGIVMEDGQVAADLQGAE
jgi:hypothetical protein